MRYKSSISVLILASILSINCIAQSKKDRSDSGPVYIDKDGVMRWKANKSEASFYGVNYTTPFAYAYRAHKALNADLEQAIRDDVYHMARLGFDAFRVHVWDNEISDVSGNLLENEHLRLFDFLLAELKKRNIKTIITPIAFWGNGYPESDENVPGFSRHYGRGKLTTNDSAIAAQDNYLRQFFTHTNPYTKLAYKDDPDVIAVEVNNEPSHSGPKAGVTKYINRLAAAIKSTGWNKPVFYNISQGPYYADAVAASVVNGFSFQWYPSGLVSNNTLKGNYLPHVDKYTIPFDTIPAFSKKALMVYEFDAADLLQSCMYPAMAKAFREAGFQWATQFAYDPMAIAYANTEYQTHYLNLAYTPSKAISMLIASRVFHKVPRLKNYGTYPADSVFDSFRVSYRESLSEMTTDQEFYYSSSTTGKPANVARLQHIAGVGNSSVVSYDGTGAYFLDKLEDGVWRLEVMPDAIFIRDPFEKASPKKEVTRIQWGTNNMKLALSDLGSNFSIKGLNDNNPFTTSSEGSWFHVAPGTYLLSASDKKFSGKTANLGPIGLNEFVAPRPAKGEMYLYHEPFAEITGGKPFRVSAKIVGIDTGRAVLQINRMGGQFRSIPMVKKNSFEYTAEVPADLVTAGMLSYRIILRKGKEISVFPGNVKGDPFAWDNFTNETWKTYVADEKGELEIYNPTIDRAVRTYPPFRRGFQTSYITGEKAGQLIMKMTGNDLTGVQMMGFQYSFIDKLQGRKDEINSFDKIVVRARSGSSPVQAKVIFICADASARSAVITLTNTFQDIEIPLNSLVPDSAILLPRPYPGFLPLFFKAASGNSLPAFSAAERVELRIGDGIPASELNKQYSLEVERICLKKTDKGS